MRGNEDKKQQQKTPRGPLPTANRNFEKQYDQNNSVHIIISYFLTESDPGAPYKSLSFISRSLCEADDLNGDFVFSV